MPVNEHVLTVVRGRLSATVGINPGVPHFRSLDTSCDNNRILTY